MRAKARAKWSEPNSVTRLGSGSSEIVAPAMRDVAVNHYVVARLVRQLAVYRLQDTGALHHIHDFIRLRVAKEVRVVGVGLDIQHHDVAVEQQRHAIERGRPAGGHARREEVPMAQRCFRIGFQHEVAHLAGRFVRGGRMRVIEQR